jgi:catechol 2,3-dioxygenase-like lactoylglutathione lyase family enzyme
MAGIKVSALDHVHLYGADPQAAAAWYGRVLGLVVHPSSARRDPGRMVYLATARGQYCATFFKGTPPSDGDHTTAFRVSGSVFAAFGDGLPDPEILGRDGKPLGRAAADDHGLAWSYYFQDPDGNHLEITSYDHARVRAWFTG